jgi:hypothetical protein
MPPDDPAEFPEATGVEIIEWEGKLHLLLFTTSMQKLARLEVPCGFPEQLLKLTKEYQP